MSIFRKSGQTTVVKQLDPEELIGFDCGDVHCNKRILRDAADPHTVKYLFVSDEGEQITTYASLSCSGVQKPVIPFAELPIGEVPTPSIISAVEIDFFATDKRFQGKRLEEGKLDTYSTYAFKKLVDRVKDMAETYAGVKAIVTYSVPRAEHFYEKCGMTRMPTDYIGRQDEFVKDCIPMILFL